MADISDVENTLVALVAGLLGLGTSYAAGAIVSSSSVGASCRVYRGWPERGQLDTDLGNNVTHISVFPPPAMVRRLHGYLFQWRQSPTVANPTLTVSVSGNVVTFAGSGGANQVAGVSIGAPGAVLGAAYAYAVLGTDTPTTVATALAALIPGATSAGAVLTLPAGSTVQAKVAAMQQAWLETRRQEHALWICVWSPTSLLRDLFAGAVDAGIANMQDQWGRQTMQFGLPDGSNALIHYSSSKTDDSPEQANLWRRDLRYVLNFPTTLLEMQPEVLFAGGVVTAGAETMGQGARTAYGEMQPATSVETDKSGDIMVDAAGNLIGVAPQ